VVWVLSPLLDISRTVDIIPIKTMSIPRGERSLKVSMRAVPEQKEG